MQPERDPPTLDRREFQRAAVGAIASYTLLGTLAACGEFPRAVAPIAAAWLRDMEELAQAVKGHAIEQVEWQARAEELFARTPLPELCALLDLERLVRRARSLDPREAGLPARFPRVEGLPHPSTFGSLVFALRRGQAVPPHGHHNMTTGFVVLEGRFHGRHFDRLEQEAEHWLLAPTIDRAFTPGMASTISDHRDNVHWFVAESERGFLFNVHVHHIEPALAVNGRKYLDPTVAPLPDGRIRAPLLARDDAFARFGGGKGLA
jgi:hypothetical protein